MAAAKIPAFVKVEFQAAVDMTATQMLESVQKSLLCLWRHVQDHSGRALLHHLLHRHRVLSAL